MRRQRNFIGPQAMGGTVALWGASSLIASIQTGTIALASVGSNTATISSVDTSRSIVMHNGQYFAPDADINQQQAFARLDLTNSTTLTATRQAATNTAVVYYAVIEFLPGVIRSVQRGSISMSGAQTTNTATITEVATAKSFVFNNGFQVQDNNGYMARSLCSASLTNSTTVTTVRWASTFTAQMSYQVVEFF